MPANDKRKGAPTTAEVAKRIREKQSLELSLRSHKGWRSNETTIVRALWKTGLSVKRIAVICNKPAMSVAGLLIDLGELNAEGLDAQQLEQACTLRESTTPEKLVEMAVTEAHRRLRNSRDRFDFIVAETATVYAVPQQVLKKAIVDALGHSYIRDRGRQIGLSRMEKMKDVLAGHDRPKAPTKRGNKSTIQLELTI